jgi:hypothetical protein
MSFLRRLLGGSNPEQPAKPPSPAEVAADDSAYERELLLDESRRLDNDLIQRQMRHADKSWTPPAQGGTRRADDTADDE